MSAQGKEADNVLFALYKKAPSLYKHQLDYRIMNVALSRVRKTLTIFYLDDPLHENLIKKSKRNNSQLGIISLYKLHVN